MCGRTVPSPRFVAECLGCKEMEKQRQRAEVAERECNQLGARIATLQEAMLRASAQVEPGHGTRTPKTNPKPQT